MFGFKKKFKDNIKQMEYTPVNTQFFVPIEKIIIKSSFSKTTPSEEKVKKYTRLFHKIGGIDTAITVTLDKFHDSNGKVWLVDGYIRYLICKEQGITMIPIKLYHQKGYQVHNNKTPIEMA